MAYTKTAWVNGGAPAISASNLGKIESGIENAIGLDTLADLRALAVPTAIFTARLLGHSNDGDGGEGLFWWDSTSSESDNDGTIVTPNSSPASGRWKRLFGGPLNVKWFGAKGDAATNDSAAINSALNHLALAPGELYFPPGTYVVNAKISKSFTSSATGIHIYGGGRDVTTLRFTGADRGFALTLSNSGAWTGTTLTVSDLTLETDDAPATAGTALLVDGGHVGGGGHIGFNVRNVYITGQTSSDGWNIGIDSKDSTQTLLENIVFNGKAFDYLTSTAFKFRGTSAPTDHSLVSCKAGGFNNGVEVGDTVEGVILRGCVFVGGSTGVKWGTTGGEPWLTIADTHINVSGFCVWVPDTGGLQQGFIHDCIFYELGNDTSQLDWRAIYLRSSFGVRISNNVFQSFNGTKNSRVAVDIDSSDRVTVIGNHIRGTTTTDMGVGISLGSTATRCKLLSNDYDHVTTRTTNTSTTNPIRDDFGTFTAGWTVSGNGNINVTVPHSLPAAPSLDKIFFNVQNQTGSYDSIPTQVISAGASDIVVKIKIENFSVSGDIRVSVDATV